MYTPEKACMLQRKKVGVVEYRSVHVTSKTVTISNLNTSRRAGNEQLLRANRMMLSQK